MNVFSDGADSFLTQRESSWMTQNLLSNTVQKGRPQYYNFNGVDSSGDTQVDIYPIPDAAYNIRFNIVLPQVELSNNADILKVPHEPVIFLAYARALAERGEDGGLASSEAAALYRQSLADAIALESGRYSEESQFYWV